VSSLLSTVQTLPDDERIAVERALVLLGRRSAIGALAPDIAHDAGNALFGLVGLLDLTEPGQTVDADLLELLRTSARELDGMARPMLRFVRGEDRRPGDLAAATREALELYRHGVRKELDVDARYSGDARVGLDQGMLLQVVVHVLLAASPREGLAVAVEAGELRVSPAGGDSIDRVVAARIAADAGGSLETVGEALVLRIPTAFP
jgi:hypothetical protein